ncbi:MAG: NAD(P)/FAD-dependent oxidoreductase, partial [Proteobacteria bacterium]|nr:NAD(P)/FAD-dependent oxidoreductase [Pseudomonadota bacterium]
SDLYTFGYRFKPWLGPPIATAEQIRDYMREVIEENDLARHIRYKHKIISTSFSRQTNLWTVEVERVGTSEKLTFTCNFLWMCQGYYRHAEGYTPDWPGIKDYRGRIVHPQTWPKDIDLKDKEVLVIGSGATTATIVPAIAGECRHVTVLQRSPTYFIPGRNINELVEMLRQIGVDEMWIHEIARKKILYDQDQFTRRSFEEPEALKQELLAGVRAFLGPDYDMTHFTPRYRPWRQRIAFVPEGDIFQGIAAGKATMVTDEIDRFTEGGVLLKSGNELKADIIITATGFNLSVLGDIPFSVDGKPVDFAKTVTYRGMMFTGVPNMVWVFGYFRASWTLRVDLLGDFVCRLLKRMDEKRVKRVEVMVPAEDREMEILPWIDPENFNPGYLMRSMHLMPRRGSKHHWQHTQDYWREKQEFPAIDLDGREFAYGA